MPIELRIPELALVVLIGTSGAGKSTLARRLFKPTEILSSDTCRGWVSDNENSLEATGDAFDVLHFVARRRLARGLLTVIDATNVYPDDRKALVAIAREFHCLPVAIVVDTEEKLCQQRNEQRPDRQFPAHVIRKQRMGLRRGIRGLQREGFRHVFELCTPEDCDNATLVREPLWNNLKHECGPFDIIGDVHGCYDELVELLTALGYTHTGPAGAWSNSAGRKLVFLGDLVDRGPKSPEVVRLVMDSVNAGVAFCVPGNHDNKFMRAVRGKKVQITHGLAESLDQFAKYEEHYRGFSRVAAEFIDDLVSHYVLDGGRLVVAHAGLKQEMHGRGSGAVREFAMYGETTGETDEFGLPVRFNWAAEYRGRAAVVYGHTPVPEPEWLNNTVCIDTGCVFGGALTALRWPEREFVGVAARATYAEPRRPFLQEADRAPLSLQQQHDDLLDLADCIGKRQVETRLQRSVTIRPENAAAALEVMSRFAIDPRWMIHLPPTMSPCETSRLTGLLEHPLEAFEYYRSNGVGRVVCQEKHMGSRTLAVVCRDADAARRRFEPSTVSTGCIYTRTGRPFFTDGAFEVALLDMLREATTRAGLWEELSTDWLLLDCELMPWSAKAQELIRRQYAAVGVGSTTGLTASVEALRAAATHLPAAEAALKQTQVRLDLAQLYVAAYRRYCWDVVSPTDLRLAPFHLLASEGRTYFDRDHLWHMQTLARLASHNPTLRSTAHRLVDLSDSASEQAAIDWWTDLTAAGGEGMVVKPLDFVARGRRGLLQPAIKVRGAEYLRIIYGPEYSLPENLDRLRQRGLGAKRSLALREFALGIEALERFVRGEPLRRVHECVFAVLALESEPVDPRL